MFIGVGMLLDRLLYWFELLVTSHKISRTTDESPLVLAYCTAEPGQNSLGKISSAENAASLIPNTDV